MNTFLDNAKFYKSPFFSEMTVDADLIYFDRPLCCLLKNAAMQFYLGHYLFEGNGTEYWFVVPLSQDQIPRLLTGRISMHDLFSSVSAEFRIVAALKERSPSSLVIDSISSHTDMSEIEEFLPSSSFVFFEDEFSEYLEEELDDSLDAAQGHFCEVLDFKLTDQTISAMPIDGLSEIFSTTQRLVTNLASYKIDPDNFGKRGKTRLSTEVQSKMALTLLKAGSVKLRFESIHQPDFIASGTDPVHEGIKELSNLLSITDEEGLCDRLKTFPPRIRSNFLSFLTAARKANTGIASSWGTPVEKTRNTAGWSRSKIEDIAERVSLSTVSEEVEFEVTGYFSQGSMGTNHFKLYDISTGRSISGKVETEEGETPDTLTLSKEGSSKSVLYEVVVHEKTTTKEDGSTSYDYKFIHIRKI